MNFGMMMMMICRTIILFLPYKPGETVHFPRWGRFFEFSFLAHASKSLPRPHCEEAPSDMEFVQNFTPPDFQANNCTPSISPNFNSFSKGPSIYYVIQIWDPGRPLPPYCNIVINWEDPPPPCYIVIN